MLQCSSVEFNSHEIEDKISSPNYKNDAIIVYSFDFEFEIYVEDWM